ncbi:MAG: FAD-dependent oxidoreductase [Alphaproteobacteria bacterium]|nr:FAD-dependent oxidoreductase [Alphaproteobacteria bacterium]
MKRVHVVGAGLAGLSTALRLAERGVAVALYEAAPQAGGRCRSFYDERVDRVIDNGNHLMLGANHGAFSYMKAIGGDTAVTEVAPAAFPFFDLANGETWTIRPNAGRIPWWMFVSGRRVPRTRPIDYLSAFCLLHPKPADTVADRLDRSSRLTQAFWEPLVVSVMIASLEEAAALPLATALRETFGRGEMACRPWIALGGLSAALVEPALARLAKLGVVYHPGWRLMQIDKEIARATALRFDAGTIELGADERVVLAVPPPAASELLPGLRVPEGTRAIVNAHFRLPASVQLPGGQPLLGLINGIVQWMIARDDIVSITVSAADALADLPADQLLPRLWRDVARVLGLSADTIPPVRLIKEKRATFLQTPANQTYRPPAVTAWQNLFLAGDWTDTGLPATIESAVRSGETAATAVLRKA